MIFLLEVLFHISKRPENGGGVAFAPGVNELSALASFGYISFVQGSSCLALTTTNNYLYLPTILVAFYSIMWRYFP